MRLTLGLRGQGADHEPAGYLCVGEASCHETEDLAFTLGQLGDGGGRFGRVA
jgi:hypothetical protein